MTKMWMAMAREDQTVHFCVPNQQSFSRHVLLGSGLSGLKQVYSERWASASSMGQMHLFVGRP
jgi:hypothetical protein